MTWFFIARREEKKKSQREASHACANLGGRAAPGPLAFTAQSQAILMWTLLTEYMPLAFAGYDAATLVFGIHVLVDHSRVQRVAPAEFIWMCVALCNAMACNEVSCRRVEEGGTGSAPV